MPREINSVAVVGGGVVDRTYLPTNFALPGPLTTKLAMPASAPGP